MGSREDILYHIFSASSRLENMRDIRMIMSPGRAYIRPAKRGQPVSGRGIGLAGILVNGLVLAAVAR